LSHLIKSVMFGVDRNADNDKPLTENWFKLQQHTQIA